LFNESCVSIVKVLNDIGRLGATLYKSVKIMRDDLGKMKSEDVFITPL
jgi:hypothetical protein